jgi:elongation factor Ts
MGVEDVKTLRERTGAGVGDCKKALTECNGDIEKAVDWLRTKGIAKAAKKAGRSATEGTVYSYIHGGGRIGVLLEVNCETDFCAASERFRALVHDLALQIASCSPEWIGKEDVDPNAVAREREVMLQKTLAEGKPAAAAGKIVDGRLNAWYTEVCLLDQKFFKDESKTVQQVITETIAVIGENIKVRRFVRYELGQGLEKKQSDFAAEVAAAAAGQG